MQRQNVASRSVLALGLVLTGNAAAQQYGYGSDAGYGSGIVRCESADGRTRECAADTRGGVRLVRQLSRAACTEGQNWGYGLGGIWVSQGCRAEFATGYGGGSGGGWNGANTQVLRCESSDGRSRQCPVDPRGGVRLVRQLSRSPCVEGRSWGVDRVGVWVSQGCRAEFAVGYRGNRGYGWGRGDDYSDRYGNSSAQLFRCESNDGRGRRCDVPVYRDVHLVRQMSRSACTEGHSWGRDRRGVWVDRGCRAEFSVR
jgi:hypothetical protein